MHLPHEFHSNNDLISWVSWVVQLQKLVLGWLIQSMGPLYKSDLFFGAVYWGGLVAFVLDAIELHAHGGTVRRAELQLRRLPAEAGRRMG